MIQPVVLPSNAPPLRNDENVYQASRVLQEHSGNRQQTDFGFSDSGDFKSISSCFNENSNPQGLFHRQPHQPQPIYPPHPLPYRQAWCSAYSRGAYRYHGPEEEARIRVEAERLYNRFRKSEAYIKYRSRQTKDGKDDQKWPDHLERAFFRALVQYPPMGRKKVLYKDKPRGRNELIVDCMEELTGEARTRKQVSSHIQVLKPFVENDPYIMKWLVLDMDAQPGKSHGRGSSHTASRRMSRYPVSAPLPVVRTSLANLPRWEFQKIQKARGDITLFQPVDFQMFVQRSCKTADGQDEVQRLHTYTHSITHPLGADLCLEEMQSLSRDFPLLANLHAYRPLECTVLDAEASLAFPVDTWKNKDGSPLPGIELGIYFLCVSCHLPATPAVPAARGSGYQVVVHNHFYENGVCATEQSGPSEARLEPSERDGMMETRIKFGSMFWAKTLGRLAGRLLDTNKDHREEVATYLKGVNAVQEVVVMSEYGAERLLVIHWKFRHSTALRGRTSWRRVILPSTTTTMPGLPSSSDKSERVDSICEDNMLASDLTDTPRHHQKQPPPALQSPFPYESSTSSTLSSATWPTSFSELSMLNDYHPQHAHQDFDVPPDFSSQHNSALDFTADNMSLAYDPTMDFATFDSSAFNFDPTAGASADFAADPALADYGQQWYTAGCYHHSFDEASQQGQAVSGTENLPSQSDVHDSKQGFGDYERHFHDADVYDNVDAQHDLHHSFDGATGAGGQQIMMTVKDGDALAALADASYIASGLQVMQEEV